MISELLIRFPLKVWQGNGFDEIQSFAVLCNPCSKCLVNENMVNVASALPPNSSKNLNGPRGKPWHNVLPTNNGFDPWEALNRQLKEGSRRKQVQNDTQMTHYFGQIWWHAAWGRKPKHSSLRVFWNNKQTYSTTNKTIQNVIPVFKELQGLFTIIFLRGVGGYTT